MWFCFWRSKCLNFVQVYRDLYPARDQAVYLDCVWKTDKFVLLENISEHVETNQDAILRDVYPGGASTVQYECIETLLGDTGSQGFSCVLSAVFLRLS